ncbi:MAG: DUF3316 domain-containing protein [Paludibacteraceae bacterium]|nr:DUF3316 domain-containing protein [Paludibacteraceae bacterium]
MMNNRKFKFILFVGCLLISCHLFAENVEHEDILKVQYGGSWRQDQYLSPLLYKGMMVGLGNEWWQPFRQDTKLGKAGKLTNWQHVGQLNLEFDWTCNPTKTNLLYAVRVNAGWGAYYQWKLCNNNLRIILGPYLDLDPSLKYIVRNVNKPVSLDATVNLMAMAGISYVFHGKHSSYRLRYLIRANVIGMDYMPDYWQSYYEMEEKVLGNVRCAGMWNHRILRHELTLDMQFPHSTWRVGLQHEYNEFGQPHMMFSHEQVAVVVGTCFRYRLNPHKKLTDLDAL